MTALILEKYGIDPQKSNLLLINSGLINQTWKVAYKQQSYILQKVNEDVFPFPLDIDHNISLLSDYVKENLPTYDFVSPINSLDQDTMIHLEGLGYFRLFPFVEDSRSYNVVHNKILAYEAAQQFAKFTRYFSAIPLAHFKIILPQFHDLSLRYQQFKQSLEAADKFRLKEARSQIEFIQEQTSIVDHFEKIKNWGLLNLRVIHHDTKISNVLFNSLGKGLCVIDLDTVMPGYFISDIGDMFRTYLCPVSEEENDFSKITVRVDYFEAIVKGYLSEMRMELSAGEFLQIVYAGKFMIYMQAVRFLTDYLNNDIYYGATYSDQNLVRATNQITLLKCFLQKEVIFDEIVLRYC